MLKTPGFWYKPVGLRATLLSPIAAVYSLLASIRASFAKPYKARVPVISIGNIVMGGAGKTPASMALAKLLQEKGYSPAIVTRGYKGSLKGPVRVSLEKHSFKEVGDEALLLCQVAPTYMAKRRDKGVMMAEEAGADIIILDDGHQTTSVKKDACFVVVGGQQKFGNGKVFPAGPLRESLSKGLARADAIIYLGQDNFAHDEIPVFHADIRPRPFPYAGKRIIAFCGLGFPLKFKESLLHMGCTIEKFIEFPDHHPYTEKDLEKIMRSAFELPIVTTAKDFIRVPHSYDHVLHVIEIELFFDNPQHVVEFLLGSQP